jgi:hypothetical protein
VNDVRDISLIDDYRYLANARLLLIPYPYLQNVRIDESILVLDRNIAPSSIQPAFQPLAATMSNNNQQLTAPARLRQLLSDSSHTVVAPGVYGTRLKGGTQFDVSETKLT